MNIDDIIRMAREAGFVSSFINEEKFEHFAALVARHEREACADVCEGHYDTAQAARAIRARGNQ